MKRAISILLALALVFSLSACGDNAADGENAMKELDVTAGASDEDDTEKEPLTTESSAVLAEYKDVLDRAYEAIVSDGMADDDELFKSAGIWEVVSGRDVKEALSEIGYALYDVDGNGTEELIIAVSDEEELNNRIILMYTLHDGKPVLLIDGWMRNRYYLLNDNTVYNESSSGAEYSTFAAYRMADDGISLEIIDYYYTGYYGDSEWRWFHNTTGEMTMDESEIIEFEDENTPANMMERYYSQLKELKLTYFADF